MRKAMIAGMGFLLAAFASALLTGHVAAQAAQPADPKAQALKPVAENANDDELQRLLKARYNEATREMEGQIRMYQSARAPFSALADAASRLIQSKLELCTTTDERIASLEQYVGMLKQNEQIAQARHDSGRAAEVDVSHARYQRLDAEVQLAREKAKAKQAQGK